MAVPKKEKVKKEPLKKDLFGGTTKKYAKQEIAASRRWFREELKSLGKKRDISDLRSRYDKKFEVGKMAYFKYDPKTKDTLPFYDTFPLIIVVEILKDGFYGLNLHYLPPKLRGLFLGRLLEVLNNHKIDKTTKLRISYKLLKSVSKYSYFRPCFKRYLSKHLRSKAQIVRPQQWPKAIMLPVAQFKKANEKTVWKHSKTLY